MEISDFSTAILTVVFASVASLLLYFNMRDTRISHTKKQLVDANTRAQAIKDLLKDEEKSKSKKQLVTKKKSSSLKKVPLSLSKSSSSASLQDLETNASPNEEENIQDLLRLSALSSSKIINKKSITGSPLAERKLKQSKSNAVIDEAKSATISSSGSVKSLSGEYTEMVPQRIPSASSNLVKRTEKSNSTLSSEIWTGKRYPEDRNSLSQGGRNISFEQAIAERDMISSEFAAVKDANKNMAQSLLSNQQSLREAALKITRLENELIDLREFYKVSSKLETSVDKLRHDNSTLALQLADAKSYITKITTENAHYKQIASSLEKTLSREQVSNSNALAEAKNTISAYVAQIQSYEPKITTLLNAQATDVEERIKATDRCRALTDEVNKLLDEKKALIIERKKVVEERAKFQGESFKAQSEKEALSTELVVLRDQIREGKQELESVLESKALLEKEYEAKLANLEDTSKRLQAATAEYQPKLAQLQDLLGASNEKVALLESAKRQLETKSNTTSMQLQALQVHLENTRLELNESIIARNSLSKQLDKLKSSSSSSLASSSLMVDSTNIDQDTGETTPPTPHTLSESLSAPSDSEPAALPSSQNSQNDLRSQQESPGTFLTERTSVNYLVPTAENSVSLGVDSIGASQPSPSSTENTETKNSFDALEDVTENNVQIKSDEGVL